MAGELIITPLLLLKDNYSYLIQEIDSKLTAIVDPSEALPVIRYLRSRNLTLDYIANTHHHGDHTGGNIELKDEFDCQIIGFEGDKDRIPGIDILLKNGEEFILGKTSMTLLSIPGHTLGHSAFYFPKEKIVFVGDTLFSIGCGRLFEGTPERMWNSLKKLRSLPPETEVYFGHEYTEANIRFALTLEPHNQDLQAFQNTLKERREQGKPSTPTTIEREARLNPFLRADHEKLALSLDLKNSDPISIFSEIRKRKDSFK